MRTWVGLFAVSALYATALKAQEGAPAAPKATRRGSVDIVVGGSRVRGGRVRYVNDGGVAAELLVGWRRPISGGVMRAVGLGIRTDLGQDCTVLLPPPGAFSGNCLPKAPTTGHLGIMSGYEVRRMGSSLRVLLGPALFGIGDRAGLGGRGHVSVAVRFSRVALTVGVNGNWLTRFDGASIRYYASSFGLRFQ